MDCFLTADDIGFDVSISLLSVFDDLEACSVPLITDSNELDDLDELDELIVFNLWSKLNLILVFLTADDV